MKETIWEPLAACQRADWRVAITQYTCVKWRRLSRGSNQWTVRYTFAMVDSAHLGCVRDFARQCVAFVTYNTCTYSYHVHTCTNRLHRHASETAVRGKSDSPRELGSMRIKYEYPRIRDIEQYQLAGIMLDLRKYIRDKCKQMHLQELIL